MKKYLKMLPYLSVNAIAFYLLPTAIKNTGSAMTIMLVGLPTICLVTAIIYGVNNSFSLFYSLIVALLFAPTIFIFYNESAVFYIAVYGVISLAGNFIGKLFCNKQKIWKNGKPS